MRTWRAAAVVVLLLALAPGCKKVKAVQALAAAEIVRVQDVSVGEESLDARVLVRWPGQSGAICIEALAWESDSGATLEAAPVTDDCLESPPGRAPDQWLDVRADRSAFRELASGKSSGRSRIEARVGVTDVVLEGAGGPGVKVADGAVVELGALLGPNKAALDAVGMPPRLRVRLTVANVLDVDLHTRGATWRATRGGRKLAEGPLELPDVLPATEEFDMAIELDAVQALAIAGATVTGYVEFGSELRLRTPWGVVVVVSEFRL